MPHPLRAGPRPPSCCACRAGTLGHLGRRVKSGVGEERWGWWRDAFRQPARRGSHVHVDIDRGHGCRDSSLLVTDGEARHHYGAVSSESVGGGGAAALRAASWASITATTSRGI